ncbi:MAG: glutamine--fructose-6-phosphate aminotransferase, partial [Oligoflexia bacterium]|nr:glutamine--fructose-6-phosphate aminotransferase [Oligoflexia bacterium]
MCGIVGSIGNSGKADTFEFLVSGLKCLEYRGYDSSGICTLIDDNFKVVRAVGRIKDLEEKLKKESLSSHIGIGHTRWATHGKVSEVNAHPHEVGSVAIVHNG